MKNLRTLEMIIDLQQEVVTSHLPLAQLKHLICVRTQSITEATGAVVEMVDGDEMVYRACSGTLASSLGLRLKIATSLSGLAVTSGEVLYCKDSESDERVNRDACRQVGARSMICVPLIDKERAVGVLKVVSPKANHFSDSEVELLRIIAGLLSASIAQAETLKLLTDSEHKFRTLIESASDGIIISQKGYILDANDSFCRMFGYKISELKGMFVKKFVAPGFWNEIQPKLESSDEKFYETHVLRKDGTSFEVQCLGKKVILNKQEVRMTTVRDITDSKRAERALRLSEQKSREATKAKSEFLANMSHEIRTPLNGILGMTGLLLDSELTPQQKSYVNIIKSSGDSLLSIVNDVLDFSKIEAGKMQLEHIPFNLETSLEDIKHILSFSLNQKKLEFITSISKTLPTEVMGDPTRLRQVLLNLISNAIKFTPEGSITVRITPDNGYVKFEIIDTGIGIPAHTLNDIFSSFTQVDSSTTRKYGGTGLGLTISRSLVQAMKGELGVESVEGQGSTFWFTIPLEEVKTQLSRSGTAQLHHLRTLEKMRVLIAEDNAVNSLIARKMLEKLGHTVSLAGNGKEALDALALAPYDVILMDCQMPEMDGYEATRQIRSSELIWKDIPIIAMTAHALDGDREKCLAAGMNDYLSKPMKLEDIQTVLARLFG